MEACTDDLDSTSLDLLERIDGRHGSTDRRMLEAAHSMNRLIVYVLFNINQTLLHSGQICTPSPQPDVLWMSPARRSGT